MPKFKVDFNNTGFSPKGLGSLIKRLTTCRIAFLPILAGSFLWSNCSSNSVFSGENSKKAAEKQSSSNNSEGNTTNNMGKDEAKTNSQKSPASPKVLKSGSDSAEDHDPAATQINPPDGANPTTNQGPENKLVVPEVCNPATGATFANLLTPTIDLGAPTSEIVYEISSTDCEGKLKLIKAESIAFDFDGVLNRTLDTSSQLKYRLVAEGTSYTGILEEKVGEDLFGNKGDKYYYFQTTQKVSTSTNSKTIRLAISLAGKAIQPRDASAPGVAVKEFILKSYLRFGATAPVTKPLTFKVGLPK